MKRRSFMAGLGLAASLRSVPGQAQQQGRQYKLGYLSLSPVRPGVADELAKAGFVQGRNLTIVARQPTESQLPAAAAEIVAAEVDVIFAGGDGVARAVLAATKTIPIVAIADNLVSSGLIPSLARPTGNLTGVNIFANELNGKRQELLLELLPGMKRLAIFADPLTAPPDQVEILRKAAAAKGIDATAWQIATAVELAPAIEAARTQGMDGVNALASPLFHAVHKEFIDRVALARLPAIFQWPEYVEEGALIGYGPRLETIYRTLVGPRLIRLLRGAKVADVPAEQPTNFELGLNLRTARALGITVPMTMLARADQVIE
jgi:putative ABC transport system substrate-binding protein